MPELKLFQIDAFSSRVFAGNPAAVCPLERWLNDKTLQAIAAENNLAETAYFVPKGDDGFHLRWFTPKQEVNLCGHATLASAFVLFTELQPERRSVSFDSRSGPLGVEREGDRLTMDFPTWTLKAVDSPPDALVAGLGKTPAEMYLVSTDDNYFAVYDSEADVRSLAPDFSALETLHPAGVVVTAPGNDADCASRYFAPSWGIPEDPATGSIHCGLVPYWAKRLGKKEIYAHQVSARGGELFCEDKGERVAISGHAVKYLEGTISI